MPKNNIFTGADILIPDYASDSKEFEKWAVIACDQFTSDISYWDTTENIIGTSPSTYNYILPEAYLETERAEIKMNDFESHMSLVSNSVLTPNRPAVTGYVFIERTLSNGKVRRGILGKIDLEEYDFSERSTANIRATEQTVAERIPPRSALRAAATIELPHAMVFSDDKTSLFDKAHAIALRSRIVYDFDLMQGGGHIRGFGIEGECADEISKLIAENESTCAIPYAVGDGNHSLAAAKALYESIKEKDADVAENHPARYALCEIVSIYDDAIEFEAIHRILKNVNKDDLLSELSKIADKGTSGQTVIMISDESEASYSFTKTSHSMTVGTLQNFIDAYIANHKEVVCDYIHGESELRELVNETSVAFMFDGFDKSNLFSYIENGPMPRKTFSMGDARSKRYYLEARVIVK